MDENHKIKELCQLQRQLHQVFNNILLYMNKILENKRDTYINNENLKEIKQEQNEINTENNKEIREFEKEILEDYIIKLNGEECIKDGDNSRVILVFNTTKKYATNKQNEIKIGRFVKVRKLSRYKLNSYFVWPYQVVKKKFNTVQLIDTNTQTT